MSANPKTKGEGESFVTKRIRYDTLNETSATTLNGNGPLLHSVPIIKIVEKTCKKYEGFRISSFGVGDDVVIFRFEDKQLRKSPS
jgi:hypothetical protein